MIIDIVPISEKWASSTHPYLMIPNPFSQIIQSWKILVVYVSCSRAAEQNDVSFIISDCTVFQLYQSDLIMKTLSRVVVQAFHSGTVVRQGCIFSVRKEWLN